MSYYSKKNILKITFVVAGILALGSYFGARLMWGEHYMVFFKGIAKNPTQVGAFTPCSVFVAEEITKFVKEESSFKKSVRVLEVGGGSGVMSVQLEKLLAHHADYHIDIVEIDPEYCAVLQKRFAFNKHVTVHCMSITDFTSDYQYDYIISTLPFTMMDLNVLNGIFESYYRLIKDGGKISYVEHMWLPDMKRHFLSSEELSLYDAKRSVINSFKNKHLLKTETVYRNITPLYVYHLHVNK